MNRLTSTFFVTLLLLIATYCFAQSNPPAPPTDLQGTAISSSAIDLTWVDNSTDEDGFQVERSEDGSTYTVVITTGPDQTTFNDTSLNGSTTYFYQVKAINLYGDSDYTTTTATTLPAGPTVPADPTNLSAAVTKTPANLAWFFRPSINADNYTLAKAFDTFILTKQDESVRDDLLNRGVPQPILQYLLSNQISDPGSCTLAGPRNQVADQVGDFCNISSQHPDWFLLDKNGNRVSKPDGTRRIYYMDPANADWRAFFISRAKQSQETLGWYGVFLDNLDGSINRFTQMGVVLANYPDDTSYRAAIEAYLNDLYNFYFNPQNRPLEANITESRDGIAWEQYIKYLDGALYENFAVNWDPNYYDTPTWLGSLNRAENALALGKKVILLSQGDQYNTSRQQFGYASFLLISAPGASFRYTKSSNYNNIWLYSNYDIDLGAPVNTRYQDAQGLWHRDFTKGYIVVDPVAHTAQIGSNAGNQVDLNWKDNSDNEDGFSIERSIDNALFTEVGSIASDKTSFSDTGLGTAYRYYYRIRAYNSAGNSNYSSAASVDTNPSTPAAPDGLSASSVSATQIDLSWNDNSSNEDGFKIERSLNGNNFSIIGIIPYGTTTYSDKNLSSSLSYTYRVFAFNSGGASNYSGKLTAGTAGAAPAVPTNLSASSASSSSINLGWTDNSINEDGFKIERSTDGSTYTQIDTVGKGVTNYGDSGLSSATQYYYRVRAYNIAGNSAYSNVSNATTNGVAPAPPNNLVASAASTTQINLTWTDNSNDEQGFQVESSIDGTNFNQIATVTSTSYQNTGLTSSTTYYYRIRAYNQWGNSAYSDVVNATTLAAPPAAPTNLSATAVSSSQINLTWTDNSSDELSFFIERSVDGANFTQIDTVGANTSSYSNTGLSSNTKYYYRVRANNAAGNSAYSNVANATTGVSAPDAPTNLAASAVSSTQIKLTWVDNSTNETGFLVERSLDGVTFTQITSLGSNITTFTDSGLAASTTYYYRIRAYNAGGNSAYSNVANATTTSGGSVPAAPTNLNATGISKTQIKLNWKDNSTNETGFKIEQSPDGVTYTQVATVGTNVTTYTRGGLTSNTVYYFRVRAYNSAGNSPYSKVDAGRTWK